MKTEALGRLSGTERAAINADVQTIQKQYPDRILTVALFDSTARGDDAPESDIDLLAICDSEDCQFRSDWASFHQQNHL